MNLPMAIVAVLCFSLFALWIVSLCHTAIIRTDNDPSNDLYY
jgi:hypothetical protein